MTITLRRESENSHNIVFVMVNERQAVQSLCLVPAFQLSWPNGSVRVVHCNNVPCLNMPIFSDERQAVKDIWN